MTVPSDGMKVDQDTVFELGTYYLPNGIEIVADGVTIRADGVTLVGSGSGRGVIIEGRKNVNVIGLTVSSYHHDFWFKDCESLTVLDCQVLKRDGIEDEGRFLDIWRGPTESYSSGMFLWRVKNSIIQRNNLCHQTAGLLMYECGNLEILDNNASYCSGWGFLLHRTVKSVFLRNKANYCNRRYWHGKNFLFGGDAAGFLLVKGSSRNFFADNEVMFGGDGFFLAGLNSKYILEPCDDNDFKNNKVIRASHIGFEATFCKGNEFSLNTVEGCNYGLWLGFSSKNTIHKNKISNCRAGLAVENAFDFEVMENVFKNNNYGLLIWSNPVQLLIQAMPLNNTSYDWRIRKNRFVGNLVAARIAANQGHGTSLMESQDFCPLPHGHKFDSNKFLHNALDIEFV